jgi:glycosyltransferase involved in cell wall biosynthesis
MTAGKNIDNNLRVTTLCSMDHGGAGTGTQRRVMALRHHGIDAHIYSLVVTSTHNYVHRIIPNSFDVDLSDEYAVWKIVKDRAISPLYKVKGFRAAELFSLPGSVVGADELANICKDADLIHLHWVVGMLDHDHMGGVFGKKPVFWSLADMNPFTGGCHYSEDCHQYKNECQVCHLLGGNSDIAHQVWKRKKSAYNKIKNLHIVCPTRWIYEHVKKSSLLGDRPCHHIPNAFQVNEFNLTNKFVARIKLGLPLDKKLILFGAYSLNNKRKGGALLQKAVQLLDSQGKLKAVEGVLFGEDTTELSIPVHALGRVTDNRRLALAYSAADVFVSPSIEDSGPMTVGEAMLCGTPVVSFKVGIAPEMIQHCHTGFLANRGNVAQLAKGIDWAMGSEKTLATRRSIKCRQFATTFHDPDVAAGKHLAVYQMAMKNV